MDELVRWLGQQLDEDERIARAASEYAEAEWHLNDIGDTILCFAPEPHVAGTERRHGLPVTADQWRGITIDHASIIPHMAEHDPARVLREIDAKRGIIRAYETAVAAFNDSGPAMANYDRLVGSVSSLRGSLERLAAVYDHRPGYKEEWRP